MIQFFLDIFKMILCMLVVATVTFLMGNLVSIKNRKASHTFCAAWLTASIGCGGCLYLVLRLLEVI